MIQGGGGGVKNASKAGLVGSDIFLTEKFLCLASPRSG